MAHLRSIRMRGFKTFAKPTELALEPGVTVIIGPNGSGKSNVADAVLWVLGEQSPSNLRGRSMQDVIFSGPDGRRSSAVAEVSLVFDNECGSLPLDCGQVEITRRLVRDGGSEYKINGSSCRLLDVQDLVGGLGLGREMHSVISQGKVEALLNSTPGARRALVEEAAGLGVFKKRRERTHAKLERTRQNLLRVSDIEREVTGALRPLRQQVVAAGRFAKATEEWALAKARWLSLDRSGAEDSLRQVRGELARLRSRREEIEAGLAELRRERLDEEQQFTAMLQTSEELSAVYHRVRSEAERVEERGVALRQRAARLEGDLERARRRLGLAEGERTSLASRLEEVGAQSADEARLKRLEGWEEAIGAALEEALPAYRALSETEDDLKDSVFELEAARSRAVQDREFLRREIEGKTRAMTGLGSVIDAARARLAELEAQAAQLEAKKKTGEVALGRAREALAAAVSRRDESRHREAEAAREEAALRETVAGLESREAVLRDVLERREGVPVGARALLASVEGCRLLSEALAVEPGCERALAAALGSLAQAVVWGDGADFDRALDVDGPFEAILAAAPAPQADGSSSAGGDSGTGGVGGGTAGDSGSVTGGRAAVDLRGGATSGAGAAPEGRAAPAGEAAGAADGTGGLGRAPTGTRDLWDLVSGPEGLIRALRALVPPTAVLDGAGRPEAAGAGLRDGAWRVVSRAGELVHPGVHVARRKDAGAEAILTARNELLTVAEERRELEERSKGARERADGARAAAVQAEEAYRRAEEALREAEGALAAAANEFDLHTRRVEEAGSGRTELESRHELEAESLAQLEADLRLLVEAMVGREAELDGVRTELRNTQARLEVLRTTVGRLRAKKSQAELVGVRLRERCRANQTERERAQAQWRAAVAGVIRYERRVDSLERYLPALMELLAVVEGFSERYRAAAAGLGSRAEEARVRSQGAAKTIRDWGGAEAELQHEQNGLIDRMGELQVDEARLDDRRAVLEEELADLRRRHLSPRELTPDDVAGEDLEALRLAVERAELRRERIGPVNPLAEQECAELEERAGFLKEQRRDLEASLSQLQDLISGLDEHIEQSFSEIFQSIRAQFGAVITTVFPGAKGTLKLTRERAGGRSGGTGEAESGSAWVGETEFGRGGFRGDGERVAAEGSDAEGASDAEPSGGIVLEVKLPNKAPRSMSLLSGGEKAMTAIAFLFSLFLARPCPFYILDEVEASLDDVNMRRFLSLVRKYRDRTQFIVITHQRQTMEIADTLYGVALESDGTSRVLSRKFRGQKDAREHAGTQEGLSQTVKGA